jgi:hypothetical protein
LLHQRASTRPPKQQTSHKTWRMFVAACYGDDVGGSDQWRLWLSFQRPGQRRESARLGIILVQKGARADPTDEGAGPCMWQAEPPARPLRSQRRQPFASTTHGQIQTSAAGPVGIA